ncbi:MAG: manganese efflux pump [Bacilli bacterium]|nr:manganese efflux pump [Bacilli bacterium]
MSAIEILVQIFLYGIALSMDAFAVSITDGLTYSDINKKKALFIAITFGVMQAIMPLISFWLVELIEVLAGQASGSKAGHIVSVIVVWLAFALILFIGIKMLVEGIRSLRHKDEETETKKFSVKEVLLYGVATAIDALATGVAFHTGLSQGYACPWYQSIWLHVSIVLVCTFVISLIGVLLGKKITKLFKGKYEIAEIIGGSILILLAIWIVLSHYLGI